MNKILITELESGKSSRFTQKYLEKRGLWDFIISQTSFLPTSASIRERYYCIKNDITELPTCYCGNPVKFLTYDSDKRYSKYCSKTCAAKSPERKEKISNSKTKLDHDHVNAKRRQTMLLKYGVEYNSQRPEVKSVLSQPKVDITELANTVWLNEEYNVKQRSLVDIAQELGVYYGTVSEYLIKAGYDIRRNSNYSLTEIEVSDWLTSQGVEHTRSDYSLIPPKEIDIVIPGKLAIEVDGLYWHSSNSNTGRSRHLSKTLACPIPLIHITDQEWNEKKDIVQSMILSRLQMSKRIYARECKTIEPTREQVRDFLSQNHIQGFIGYQRAIGLEHNGELIQLMTFGKSRFNKNYEFELLRFCSKLGTNVVGGGSKILSLFKHPLITYADRRFSEGNGYLKMGFEFSHSTEPGYFYTDGNRTWSRFKFQKHKLKDVLPIFDETKPEMENMFNNGYRIFYDCGNNVLTKS